MRRFRPGRTLRTGGGQTGVGALDREFAFHLRQRGNDVEEEPARVVVSIASVSDRNPMPS
ncbi:hypothetical protein [Pseudarthrobacter albicanus]|uniref:hypothetical protein n=1 Tax=Pseudarthrobacter albicanus TaxID=2823873 RepID=UPI0024847587